MITFLQKLLGDPNEAEIKKLWPIVKKINEIEEGYQKSLTDADIPLKTIEFKERLAKGESLDDLLPEAFALVKNACRRLVGKKWPVRGHDITWDMVPFDVQLIGGMVLHRGRIAEMKTGEGKTLVCTLPFYLNALEGRGVFLVTVNDYLAQRDAEWMGGLYNFLGMTVGVVMHGQDQKTKYDAYRCDITYGTNNEYGFDYLRDNMSTDPGQIVQRELHYAIVDEVDSILIDEARTPLIISTPAEESTDKYFQYARLVTQLVEKEHYMVDEKLRAATLTEAGIARMEELLGMKNMYEEGGFETIHHMEQALKAHAVFKRDVDYVVREGEVLIVDEFTGRLMPGRRYSDGLHQSLEAKENVEVNRETRTLATVSFQNYFRLFHKLAGMTGTAVTEAEEFAKIYKLDTIVIPTNRTVTRIDYSDAVYKNQRGKFMAAVEKVKQLHAKGQPVLIGTISIERSELLSKLLQANGVPHTVLNAKNHEQEAEIVANAGRRGAVTIATNMAGRGTDIKLAEGVNELGGLFVLGTERHESRRIDNQLRGRSGRQGDPGASQFLVSMDDDLMRLFGADRVQRMMDFLKVPDDMPIENRIITNSIEGAQKKVEARNFDVRKHLVEYDDIMNKHREIIYARRRKMLFTQNVKNDVLLLLEEEAEQLVLFHTQTGDHREWGRVGIKDAVETIHKDPEHAFDFEQLERFDTQDEIIDMVKHYLRDAYIRREKSLPDYKEGDPTDSATGSAVLRMVERSVYLRTLDLLWMEHIDNMTHLREAVSLRGYAQRDPLIEYKQEAFTMFTTLLNTIRHNTVLTLFRIEFQQEVKDPYMKSSEEPKNLVTNEAQIESNLTGGKPEASSHKSGNVAQAQDSHEKIGRNDPCHCGSGKKYKKCHGAEA
ncbi:preprotein translocase subunit SecA [Candidatus Gracilibacteria bacterium]|nr:preprotein translocase subunit SecA [Candidatus Gracilibacteria bacterium]